MSDETFMRRALALATRAAGRTSPNPMVGAVIVKGGRVVGEGYHHAAGKPHAEVEALRKAGAKTRGATCYVTLEPCAMCLGALLQARVRRLVFGARDPKAGAAGSVVDLTNVAVFNHHLEVVSGVRAAECAALLQRFFAARR